MKIFGIIICVIFICTSTGLSAQTAIKYTIANAHSHNDYKQKNPFYEAYDAGFGSMEADVYLVNNALLVAHSDSEINVERNLEALYLKPLSEKIKLNNGYPYADTGRKFQLLIELKSSPDSELPALQKLLDKYSDISLNKNIQIVFTGISPSEEVMMHTPEYMYFDYMPGKYYSGNILSKIAMFSDDFKRYTKWDGAGKFPEKDFEKLKDIVAKYHRLHKKVRFWDTPDNKATWRLMEALSVDYINTDKIRLLAAFLDNSSK